MWNVTGVDHVEVDEVDDGVAGVAGVAGDTVLALPGYLKRSSGCTDCKCIDRTRQREAGGIVCHIWIEAHTSQARRLEWNILQFSSFTPQPGEDERFLSPLTEEQNKTTY